MAVKGVFASDQQIVGNRVGDFASFLLQQQPTGSAPLLALTSGMMSEECVDTVIHWFEETKITGRTAVVSGGTGTTVVVSDGSSYVPGTILMVEDTGEYMLVTAVATNSLTVTRGLSGTSISSLSGGEYVMRIGNGHEEGSGRPTAVVNQGYPRSNLVQIFRNAWAITGTTKAVQFHTGKQIAKNKSDCMAFHAEDIERSFLWGRKALTTLNGKAYRLTDGVITQTENYGGVVQSQSTNTTMKKIRSFLRQVFENNIKGKPNERIALAGNIALETFNEAAALDGMHELETTDTEWGLQIHTLVSPFGKVKILTHPLMNENPVLTKDLYVLHPGGIKRRDLRKTFPEDYDSNGNRINGVDADEGIVTTEAGIQCMLAQCNGIYSGADTAAASS